MRRAYRWMKDLGEIFSEGERRLVLTVGLAVLFLLGALAALGSATVVAQPLPNVGLNGNPCAYANIRTALGAAQDGDTIYVDVSEIHTGTTIGLVDKNVTIAAAANSCQTPTSTLAIVNGGGLYDYNGGMMEIFQSHAVTLSHVRLENTRAYRGGVVYIDQDGRLVLEASGVISGRAQGEAGGVYVGYGATLIMTDTSAVYANVVTDTFATGGGISAYSGTIRMTNSYVGAFGFLAGNGSANSGGGVYLDRGRLYMEDSVVMNNAAVDGGGIYAFNESVISMTGNSAVGSISVFYGNSADNGGGVLLTDDSALLMADNSEVSFNVATDFGGGAYVDTGSVVNMDGASTRIYSNTATFGGGAVVSGTGATLYMSDGAQVVDNSVSGTVADGGGLYITNGGFVYGGPGAILDNHADLLGGGVYVDQTLGGTPSLFNLDQGSLMHGNSAIYGGALYVGTGDTAATIVDSRISGNSASAMGGGVRVFGNSTVIFDSTIISGNVTTDGDGGGVAINDGEVEIVGSSLLANEAITNGGGIQQTGGRLTVFDVQFYNNAAEYGGGLYVNGATSMLTNTRLLFNVVGTNGGGIAALNGSDLRMDVDFTECSPFLLPTNVYCSEVRGNQAANQGAGVFVEDSTAQIAHTGFVTNVGSFGYSHGGALMVGTSAVVSVTDTLFTGHGQNGNTAVHVYNQADYFSDNSTYAGNHDVPLFVVSQGSASLNRNIIWDNGASPTLQGSISSYCNDTQSGLPGGTANFSSDPMFVTTARGPYRLSAGSPAIDACAPGISDRGLDGRKRGIMHTPGQTLINYDVGAFEFPRRVFLPLVVKNAS